MKTPKTVRETSRAQSKDERLFFGIVSYSTALAFGGMLASLEALYNDTSGFSFHFSVGTLAAFAIGFAVGLIYWRIVSLDAAGGASLLLRASSFLLLLGGVAAFLYPLRFLPAEKLHEVLQGLTAAVVALSLIALMLWRLKIFFDQDAAKALGKNAHTP
jgi:hypothetical protein